MRCQNCGRINRDNSVKCFACSFDLSSANNQNPPPPPPEHQKPLPPPPPSNTQPKQPLPPPPPPKQEEDLPEMVPIDEDEMLEFEEEVTFDKEEEELNFDEEEELDFDEIKEEPEEEEEELEFDLPDEEDEELDFEEEELDFDDEEEESPGLSEEEEEVVLKELSRVSMDIRMKAMQLTQSAMYRISNLKAKGVISNELDELIDKAISTTDYAYSMKLANQTIDKIIELEKECDARFFQETAEKFHYARSQIIIANSHGKDIEAAESLLEDASQAIARSNYIKADGLITLVLKKIE